MTIQFSGEEFSQHVSKIDKWRYNMELIWDRILTKRFGEEKAKEIFTEYRAKCKESKVILDSPINGTRLEIWNNP